MGKEGRAIVGEVTWDNVEVKSGGGSFKRLESGENRIRIVSNPIEFRAHWIQQASRRIICLGEDCPACKADVKIMQRWMLKILDRSDQTIKPLEIGTEIMSGIVKLAQDEEWGKVSKYDIKIIRTEGKRTSYQVIPCQKSNPTFTDKEKELITESQEKIDIKKIIESQIKDKIEVQKTLKGEVVGNVSSNANNSNDDDDFLNEEKETKKDSSNKKAKEESKEDSEGDGDFLDLD